MPLWTELTHPDFIDASNRTEVVVLITGALEAHGKHLPLGTDTILPDYLAEKIAKETNALVLPPIPYGDSWSFDPFAGTVSVSPETLVHLYHDVMKSVFNHGFRFIIALNGHGPNAALLQQAAKRATAEGEHAVIIVNWWIDFAKTARKVVLTTPEGHAAEDETSEMLFVRPDLVDEAKMVAGRVETKYRIVSARYREDLLPNAIYGNPLDASADKGRIIIEEAIEELMELVGQLERGKLPLLEKDE
ncbi:MAG: creatininase family protein [Candidatus Lokiarchaeota archaeon]|nr:creatininase family protein [Candidatus Lokiarchaeota archaeon]